MYHISLRRFLASLRTPVNLFSSKIHEISGTQHTQITENKSEIKNKSHRQKEWEEEARKPHKDFHLLQLRKNMTNETSSSFFFFSNTFTFHDFCRFLELKCNFPHFWKNAFDLYKLFWKSRWLEFVSKHFYWTNLLVSFKTLLLS